MPSHLRVAVAALLLFSAVLAGCGGADDEPPFEVTTRALSHEATQAMRVWRPKAGGPWPVVYALPGISGDLDRDLGVLAPALARQGLVVFATDLRVQGSSAQQVKDAECGYRYARTVAGKYGGDLSEPVTLLGYSYTAAAILTDDPALFGPGGSYAVCFHGVPPADVRVGVNGCYYGRPGQPEPFQADRLPIRKSDSVVLIASQQDRSCPAWQSERAAKAMRRAGYDVTLDVIPGADHYGPIFHALVGQRWKTVSDSPAGRQTVRDVVAAIGSHGG